MLVDRHRTAAVIELSRVPEAERAVHQDALETLLVHLYQNATPAARAAFRKRMDPLPASDKPWGALVRPNPAQWVGLGPPVPAVLVLLVGQQDDDPDSAEDGNRLPDRDSKAGARWVPLYAALDRWDTAAILRHIGPTGWQLPLERPVSLDEGYAVELVPGEVVLSQSRPGPGNTPAPTEPPKTEPASTPAVPDVPPGEPATAVVPLWRRPAVLTGGAAALTVGGLVVYALARPRSTQVPPVLEDT